MFDSVSGAEKIGWLSVIGGIIVACVQVAKWLSQFSTEHETFKAHLLRAEPLLDRLIVVEEAVKQARLERAEMLAELRGIRQDMNEMFRLLVEQKGE